MRKDMQWKRLKRKQEYQYLSKEGDKKCLITLSIYYLRKK